MKTPYPHQTAAIEVIDRKNLLLSDDCGLGKTLVAIIAGSQQVPRFNRSGLIIVPKTLREQWQQEILAQDFTSSAIELFDGQRSIDRLNSTDLPMFTIIHYEAVVKWVNELERVFFSFICVDEAHRIKNRSAQRTSAIKRLVAHRKLAMTGTPYDKNPADVWSILNWLEPDFFRSYWQFYNSHVNYKEIEVSRGKWVKVINKAQPVRDTENFARLLRQFSLKRTKKEVRSDLPERIDQYVDLQMNSDQADYYAKIVNAEDMLVALDDNELNDQLITIQLTRILRLIQVTTDPTLLGVKSSSVKLNWVMDWLEDNPSESVIIFTRFRETAIKLHKQLEGFQLIIGGEKRRIITSEDRGIVGTIATMGVGLDLPHIDNAIFIDVEWSSILMQQAIDRIHRINIDNVKHLYFLRCQDTVDELVYRAVRDKWSTKELVENFLRGSVALQREI